MFSRVAHTVAHEVDRIAALRARRVLSDGAWIVTSREDELTRHVARGAELVERCLADAGARLTEARGHLRALSPLRTLERGYAIVLGDDGAALRSTADAPAGTALTVRVTDGAIAATSDGPVGRRSPAPEVVGARS
jgi:exodeoxyribonuclease VII large subunit